MIRLGLTGRDRYKWLAGARFLPGLIIIVLSLNWGSAFGEEIPAGPPPVPENVEPPKGAISADEGFLDSSHGYLDRKFNGLVRWFDGLFGDTDESDSAMAKNWVRWSNDLRAEDGKGLKYQSSLRVHLRLPKLEKWARLVIMEDTREEAVAPVPSDPGTPVANTPTNANTFRALHSELRYYAHDTKAGYAFLAAGSRFRWPLETFVRARLLWRHPLGDNTFISPSATPFWQDHIGFGATPQLDFGHRFAHDYVFLWTNSATMFEKRPGFLWGTEVSLSRILSPVTAIAFAVGANGSTRPSTVADRYNMAANSYRVTFKYRRNIHRPWLFLELIPEANWRRNEGARRELIPAFTARLEVNSLGRRALLPAPLIVKEPQPVPIDVDGLDGVRAE